MEIIVLIVLGLVQGLTEFLPVSSSGHLVLLSQIFGISDSLFVSIMLHIATLLSIMVVLRKEIFYLIRHPFSKTTMLLAVASIPTCAIALILMPLINSAFAGGFLGICFFITAVLLLICSQFKKQGTEELTFKQAFIMGIAQGFAILPGISRSGSTISAGLLSGANREQTAKFSFLMSLPIILLSLVMEVYEIAVGGQVIQVNIVGLILAFVFAFLVGVLALKVMIKLTQRAKFKWFSIYLVFIAILTMFI